MDASDGVSPRCSLKKGSKTCLVAQVVEDFFQVLRPLPIQLQFLCEAQLDLRSGLSFRLPPPRG